MSARRKNTHKIKSPRATTGPRRSGSQDKARSAKDIVETHCEEERQAEQEWVGPVDWGAGLTQRGRQGAKDRLAQVEPQCIALPREGFCCVMRSLQ